MDSKSRIPTGRRRGKNVIPGGPVAPNYKLMSASEASDARIEYHRLRKIYRDGICRERLRGNKGESFDEEDYTGDQTPTLRPMALVLSARLQVGHTFPESSLVKLRVAEEANHRGIYFSVHKSDETRLICKGEGSFFSQAPTRIWDGPSRNATCLCNKGINLCGKLPRASHFLARLIRFCTFSHSLQKRLQRHLWPPTRFSVNFSSHSVEHIVSQMPSYRVRGRKHGGLFLEMQTTTSHTRTS
jgi:hypothetical protein